MEKYTIIENGDLFIDVMNNETEVGFKIYAPDYNKFSYTLEQWEMIDIVSNYRIYYNHAVYTTDSYKKNKVQGVFGGSGNYQSVIDNTEYKELFTFLEDNIKPLYFYMQMEKDGYILLDKKGERLADYVVLKKNKKNYHIMKAIINEYKVKAHKDINDYYLTIPTDMYERISRAKKEISFVWS